MVFEGERKSGRERTRKRKKEIHVKRMMEKGQNRAR